MLKRVIKFFDAISDTYQAHMEYRRFGRIRIGDVIEKIEDVEVYCSDRAVSFGGILKSVPGAIVGLNDRNQSIIIINRRMRDQERWFIDGVLAHELGHIRKNHHLKNKFFEDKHKEIEADEYALSLGHNMLEVLRRCREFGYNVNYRINHIRSLLY